MREREDTQNIYDDLPGNDELYEHSCWRACADKRVSSTSEETHD